MLTCATSELT